jgi:hypothetical protein
MLTLLKERLPYPDSWCIDGILIERRMMKKAVIIFMGIEFFTMLAATDGSLEEYHRQRS